MSEDQANPDNQKGGGGNNDQQDGGGNKPPAWTAQLDKDLQGNEKLTQFKTIGEMGKAFLDRDGKLQNSVLLPGEKATAEEKAAYYAKLGRPDKPDGYEITKPADLPESLPYDPALATEYQKFAFEAGLSKSQAKAAWDFYFGLAKNGTEIQAKEIEKAQTDGINTLKTDWGAKFDGNKKIAEIAFKKYGKEAASLLDEAKIGSIRLGDHPAFLKVFYEIGMQTMDDKALKGEGGREQISGDSDKQTATLMFPSMQKKE